MRVDGLLCVAKEHVCVDVCECVWVGVGGGVVPRKAGLQASWLGLGEDSEDPTQQNWQMSRHKDDCRQDVGLA